MKVLLHVGMSGIRQKKRVGILRSGRCASPTVINVWHKLIADYTANNEGENAFVRAMRVPMFA